MLREISYELHYIAPLHSFGIKGDIYRRQCIATNVFISCIVQINFNCLSDSKITKIFFLIKLLLNKGYSRVSGLETRWSNSITSFIQIASLNRFQTDPSLLNSGVTLCCDGSYRVKIAVTRYLNKFVEISKDKCPSIFLRVIVPCIIVHVV